MRSETVSSHTLPLTESASTLLVSLAVRSPPLLVSSSYASTDFDTVPREQLSAHEVLCPGCYSHDLSNRDILLQKCLYLSQFLRLFMIIDGVFLVLWALLAWPFFLGLLLIIMGFYGVKYYNTALSSMVNPQHNIAYVSAVECRSPALEVHC